MRHFANPKSINRLRPQKLTMAHCSKYVNRFREVLKFRKLPFPEEIVAMLSKRAKTDRELDGIICRVTDVLEPPACKKSHCPHHTAFAFCGCSQGLVPSTCSLHKEYIKRKSKRENDLWEKRNAQIPGIYKPISDETKSKILAMSNSEWEEEVKKFPKELTGKTN